MSEPLAWLDHHRVGGQQGITVELRNPTTGIQREIGFNAPGGVTSMTSLYVSDQRAIEISADELTRSVISCKTFGEMARLGKLLRRSANHGHKQCDVVGRNQTTTYQLQLGHWSSHLEGKAGFGRVLGKRLVLFAVTREPLDQDTGHWLLESCWRFHVDSADLLK
jgi:hypothetical protein